MALPLRDGVKLEGAIQTLRQCGGWVGSLARGGSGDDVESFRHRYLQELDRVEGQLRNLFADPAVWTHLRGDRHRVICAMSTSNPTLARLITEEAEDQKRYFEQVTDRLERFVKRLGDTQGGLVVLDTNVLLHYQPPWQVDWTAVLGSAGPVRLVLPLRVIEELDERKYRDREKIAQRARDLLSELWKVLSPSKGGPAPLGGKPGITVEVFLDDEPRRHTLDADAEILEECRTLKAVGCPVSLVTADTGLSIRASALGIAVVPMPDKYLRNKPAPPRN